MYFSLLAGLTAFLAVLSSSWGAGEDQVRQLWARRSVLPGFNSGTTVRIDSFGDVIVLARSRRLLVLKYAGSRGAILWQQDLGQPWAERLAVDSEGYVVALANEGGDRSDTVVRISPSGKRTWQRRLQDKGGGLAVDADGNVIVSNTTTTKYARDDGSVLWQRNHSGGVAYTVVSTDSSGDVILGGSGTGLRTEKLSGRNGESVWDADFEPIQGAIFHEMLGVAVDTAGNVSILGHSIAPGVQGVTRERTSKSIVAEFIPYVARYSADDGALIWEKQWGVFGRQPTAIASDRAGNVILAGTTFRAAKYSAEDGALVWNQEGGGVLTAADAIAVDGNDNAVTTGTTNDSTKVYVAKYDGETGNRQWERRYPNKRSRTTLTRSLAVNPGLIAVTGLSGGDIATIKYADGATPQTLSAELIDSSHVRLRGTVNPNRFVAKAAFIYGTDPTLRVSTTTTPVTIRNGREPVEVEAIADSLEADTLYYYSAVGFAADGETTRGEIRSFKTPHNGR